MHATMRYLQNDLAYFATTVNYEHKNVYEIDTRCDKSTKILIYCGGDKMKPKSLNNLLTDGFVRMT